MPTPRLTGVLGDPVGHSKSPLIHNTWLKAAGLEGAYVPIELPAERFGEWLRLAPELGFVGFNVTIPHKRLAYEEADRRLPAAARSGGANTLWWDDDGALCADSTDGFGFLENLAERAPGRSWMGARAVLLGAGGAAQAVTGALLDAGVAQLTVINRTLEKAEAVRMLDPARIRAFAWPPPRTDLAEASLLVNGTSLGMTGQPPLDLDWPDDLSHAVATDLVYAPLETPFLRAAAERGATTVDGLGMLLHQARPGFERWYGVTPTVDQALRDRVLNGGGYLP